MTTFSQILIFIGVLITASGGLLYYFNTSKETDERHEELIQKSDTIKKDLKDVAENIIANQDSGFNKIHSDIKKVSTKLSDTKNNKPDIQNPSNSTIQINEKGDNIINQPKEQYKPKIVFFKNETKIIQDSNSGLIIMKFYFGSQDGFPLINPIVDITFSSIFTNINGGVTGSGMVIAGNLEKEILEGNKRFIIRSNILNASNYFIIETTSTEELKIIDLKLNP